MIGPLDASDPDTARTLVALQRAAYAVEAALIGSDAIPALTQTPAELASEDLTHIIAGDPPVAFVAYRREEDGAVDIHKLVVDPSAFRQGLATRLLDAVVAAEPGAGRFVVATAAANAPALALYARRGFRRTGERLVTSTLRVVELEWVPLAR